MDPYLARMLLQDHDDDDVHEYEDNTENTENTKDVRIIAIFTILVAALLGGFLPLCFKCFRNQGHPATLILRAVAAGVMLALALIHIIPDGMADLGELTEFPWASCCVIFGIIVMVFLEDASRTFLTRMQSQNSDTAGNEPVIEVMPATQDPANLFPEASKPSETCHKDDGAAGHDSALSRHSHTCLAVNNAANWASNPHGLSGHGLTLRNQIMAYMFELGCVIHSFLIGLSLGVTVDSRSQAVALTVALIFHQALEGVGLGTTVLKAQFNLLKSFIMIFSYALMTPIGVAIGMGIADSYKEDSTTSLAVQGTLNSISGGLLLYISLVQLIAEDFSRTDAAQSKSMLVKVGMHVALLVGVSCMTLLAKWA